MILSDFEIKEILNAAKNSQRGELNYLRVLILAATGCKTKEAVKLQFLHIDLSNEGKETIRFGSRQIPLADKAAHIIKKYRTVAKTSFRLNNPNAFRVLPSLPSEFFVMTLKPDPLDDSSLRYCVGDIGRAAKLRSKLLPSAFRNTLKYRIYEKYGMKMTTAFLGLSYPFSSVQVGDHIPLTINIMRTAINEIVSGFL